MSWIILHKSSEIAAAAAHEALRLGRSDEAKELFQKAADSEEASLAHVEVSQKPRTFGITAVSAVALWYKARQLAHAEQLAHRVLSMDGLPQFAADQLRGMLQTIWNENIQEAADICFMPEQITVSIDGGKIVRGGAPLDLVVEKVQTIQSLFYRTAEFIQNLPFRRSGPPPKPIQELCRPWLFQSVPGSYQFTIAIEGPQQVDMFPENVLNPKALTSTFMSIIETAATDPGDSLTRSVPDGNYRSTFLKLARNLAPTGSSFSKLEIRSAQDGQQILFTPESRAAIRQTIQITKNKENPSFPLPEITLRGSLRAVHLDKDWLEVLVDGGDESIHVMGVNENVDDVIGPMVNHRVVVQVAESKKGYLFRDIELDE